METKHTPGPWRATRDTDARGNHCWRIDAPAVSLLATLSYATAGGRAEGIHDARLIAAAPDLLAALVEYVERHEAACNPEGLPEYDQARAAIAKAKGQA